MTDREKAGLRGPVRVCITEEVTYVRGWMCGPDGCRPTGDPQERRTRSVAEYDIAGRLVRQTYRDTEGREHTWENPAEAHNSAREVRMDRQGRKVQITRVPAEFLSRSDTEYSHAIEGSDTFYSARGAAVIETLLDEAERPAEVTFLNRRGRRLCVVTLTRDSEGRLTKVQQYLTGRGQPFWMRVAELMLAVGQRRFRRESLSSVSYRYDSHGRLEEKRFQMGPLGDDCQYYDYNVHGDRVREVNEHYSRTVTLNWRLRLSTISEQRSWSETHIEYLYDERGNWTEQRVSFRTAPDALFEVSSERRRMLDYHTTTPSAPVT